MRRTTSAVLYLAVTALVTAGLATPAKAAESRPQSGAANVQAAACVPVAGRFYNRWMQNPNAFGCAVGYEGSTYNGTFQNFERGQIVWSPSQGGNMIISGYRFTYWNDWGQHTGIHFHWNYSDPFNYDVWLVRLDRNGGNLGQWDCWAGGSNCWRTGGWWNFAPVAAGGYSYRFVVEGCDGFSSKTCRQGWTIPVWLWV